MIHRLHQNILKLSWSVEAYSSHRLKLAAARCGTILPLAVSRCCVSPTQICITRGRFCILNTQVRIVVYAPGFIQSFPLDKLKFSYHNEIRRVKMKSHGYFPRMNRNLHAQYPSNMRNTRYRLYVKDKDLHQTRIQTRSANSIKYQTATLRFVQHYGRKKDLYQL